MTKKVGNVLVIEPTTPAECSQCGQIAELRPYGKGGAWICYECGMTDLETTDMEFEKLLNGERDI